MSRAKYYTLHVVESRLPEHSIIQTHSILLFCKLKKKLTAQRDMCFLIVLFSLIHAILQLNRTKV